MAGPIPGVLSNGERCDSCEIFESDKSAQRAVAIEVLKDFFSIEADAEPDFSVMSRRLYKATSCGAWIVEEENGIAIGSIVEGSDCDCETHIIEWALVTSDEIQKAIDAIEAEAEELWEEANCEDDDPRAMGWAGLDVMDCLKG
jgi:hypothetical protein